MYWITHAAVGAAIGSRIQDPMLGIVAGLLSHAVLDAIPHSDYEGAEFGIVDFVAGALFVTGFALDRAGPGSVWAIAGATFPDLEVALAEFGLIDRLWFPSHSGLLTHGRLGGILGVIIQGLTLGLALSFL